MAGVAAGEPYAGGTGLGGGGTRSAWRSVSSGLTLADLVQSTSQQVRIIEPAQQKKQGQHGQ